MNKGILDKAVSEDELTFRMILVVIFLSVGTVWMLVSAFISSVPWIGGFIISLSAFIMFLADAFFS